MYDIDGFKTVSYTIQYNYNLHYTTIYYCEADLEAGFLVASLKRAAI